MMIHWVKISKEVIRKIITLSYIHLRLNYISRLDFLFKETFKHLKKKQTRDPTTFLDSLPYCLKHSLFLDTAMMSKMRAMSDMG